VAKNRITQDVVDVLLNSMNKNLEDGWIKGDGDFLGSKELKGYEERVE
jgi:hypothetical protein